MTDQNRGNSSRNGRILSLLRVMDRKIEAWVLHVIDQIETEEK